MLPLNSSHCHLWNFAPFSTKLTSITVLPSSNSSISISRCDTLIIMVVYSIQCYIHYIAIIVVVIVITSFSKGRVEPHNRRVLTPPYKVGALLVFLSHIKRGENDLIIIMTFAWLCFLDIAFHNCILVEQFLIRVSVWRENGSLYEACTVEGNEKQLEVGSFPL